MLKEMCFIDKEKTSTCNDLCADVDKYVCVNH